MINVNFNSLFGKIIEFGKISSSLLSVKMGNYPDEDDLARP